MRNTLLGGVAIAGALTLMLPVAPALAQGGCGIGHPCSARNVGGAAPAQFRYRGHGYAHGYGRGYRRGDGYRVGAGVVAGLAAGAIIGGALQQNQGYYPETYPADSYPVYSEQVPSDEDAGPVVATEDGDSVAYCERTYRSFDPTSGTYLGYDGLRHPCP
jgi:hypothetical protein